MRGQPNPILSTPATVEACAADMGKAGRDAEYREQRGQVSASANDGRRTHAPSLPDHYGGDPGQAGGR